MDRALGSLVIGSITLFVKRIFPFLVPLHGMVLLAQERQKLLSRMFVFALVCTAVHALREVRRSAHSECYATACVTLQINVELPVHSSLIQSAK